MRIARKTILITTLFLVVVASADTAKTKRMTANQKRAKALKLLDKFTEIVDKAHVSFITKAKCEIFSDRKHSGQWAYLNGERTRYHLQEFRTDGKRMKHILQQWGDYMGSDGKLFSRPESDKSYRSDTYNGEKRYQFAAAHDDAGRVIIQSKKPKKSFIAEQLAYDDNVSACFGYLNGDIERFDHILKKAGTGKISVRDKMEDLNGTAHYVIDAKTNRGKYTVWLNPEKGYNFSKAVVLRKAGDFFMAGYKVDPGTEKKCLIENTRFIDVNGVWVPAKAKMRIHHTLPPGGSGNYIKIIKDVELTSILIKPDHDALGSFLIDDIKEGAVVIFKDGPPAGNYKWRDGKVVDENGKTVMDCLKKPKGNKK